MLPPEVMPLPGVRGGRGGNVSITTFGPPGLLVPVPEVLLPPGVLPPPGVRGGRGGKVSITTFGPVGLLGPVPVGRGG